MIRYPLFSFPIHARFSANNIQLYDVSHSLLCSDELDCSQSSTYTSLVAHALLLPKTPPRIHVDGGLQDCPHTHRPILSHSSAKYASVRCVNARVHASRTVIGIVSVSTNPKIHSPLSCQIYIHVVFLPLFGVSSDESFITTDK